ncbi:hypothetical protein Z949_629 [Sulfitobacter guttiformis KCTC 32187]|nr:hypothetical protein Z949_629 [Sulfitobacter guttiformis KCTC 32187]
MRLARPFQWSRRAIRACVSELHAIALYHCRPDTDQGLRAVLLI